MQRTNNITRATEVHTECCVIADSLQQWHVKCHNFGVLNLKHPK